MNFSALNRKNATTGDARLNHLMILYVHRDGTDTIDLTAVANQFVEKQENRTEAVVWLDVYLQ